MDNLQVNELIDHYKYFKYRFSGRFFMIFSTEKRFLVHCFLIHSYQQQIFFFCKSMGTPKISDQVLQNIKAWSFCLARIS